MADAVELRMKCPVCRVRNHSVTFLADGPTIYHDCGHIFGDTPKMVRETLCVAQTAVGALEMPEDERERHIDRLQRMIDQIDRGRHGD